MTYAQKTLLARLNAFKMAAFSLSDAWQDVAMEDPTKDFLTEGYPFAHDFEEMLHQIMAWEESAEKELNLPAKEPLG